MELTDDLVAGQMRSTADVASSATLCLVGNALSILFIDTCLAVLFS